MLVEASVIMNLVGRNEDVLFLNFRNSHRTSTFCQDCVDVGLDSTGQMGCSARSKRAFEIKVAEKMEQSVGISVDKVTAITRITLLEHL